MRLFASLILILALASACDKNYFYEQNPNQPTNPSTQPTNQSIRVDYRVSGNAITARIRYSNPLDGLTQLITALPFSVSFTTTTDSIFLSLEATPLTYPNTTLHPFTSVQIFVNGTLFREASSADFVVNPIVVNGTWRR